MQKHICLPKQYPKCWDIMVNFCTVTFIYKTQNSHRPIGLWLLCFLSVQSKGNIITYSRLSLSKPQRVMLMNTQHFIMIFYYKYSIMWCLPRNHFAGWNLLNTGYKILTVLKCYFYYIAERESSCKSKHYWC